MGEEGNGNWRCFKRLHYIMPVYEKVIDFEMKGEVCSLGCGIKIHGYQELIKNLYVFVALIIYKNNYMIMLPL